MITIIFDMFFTVILFKILYAKLVRMAGFSQHGREWIANGMVSTFISFITYQVYANMTRYAVVSRVSIVSIAKMTRYVMKASRSSSSKMIITINLVGGSR